MSRPVAIVAASAISAHGLEWRTLGPALRRNEAPTSACAQLSGIAAAQVLDPMPDDVEPKVRARMSRGARLASVATRRVLREAGWNQRGEVGFFLGVGASGGSTQELEAMLAASFEGQRFDLARFGSAGLAACNPLFAFQLMNNFTLCHAAIREGTQGPNLALFSRGSGTVTALAEAAWAISSGECDRALAGGSDSALHPVTWAEQKRGGEGAELPAEGAALLALAAGEGHALAYLDGCEVLSGRAMGWRAALEGLEAPPGGADVIVAAASGLARRDALRTWAIAHLPGVPVLDCGAALGETLAAAAALGCAAALSLLQGGEFRRAAVLVAGPDGDLGRVMLSKGGA